MPGPTSPPIQLSGRDASLLVSPHTSAPVGAVTVNPGVANALQNATTANVAGTTFWLSPGTHTNNFGEFGQVVPKAGNSYIGAPGAIIDGQLSNHTAFGGAAADVTLSYLTIQNFDSPRDQVLVNHDFAAGWELDHCKIWRNRGGALALGSNCTATYCLITENAQYGWQSGGPPGGFGAVNTTMDFCEVSLCGFDDWERRVYGCGCSGGCKYWFVENAIISNSWIHSNGGVVGIWGDTNNGKLLIDNCYISDNYGNGFEWEISYNFRVANTTFARNAFGQGRDFLARGETTFPVGAIYISESGGEASLFGGTYAESPIEDCTFIDNYGGVVLWEHGDRFGHDDSANTSKGYTTLLVPGGENCVGQTPVCTEMAVCGNPATGGSITTAPYTDDCRWKTKNVKVRNNLFECNPTRVGLNPAVHVNMGRQAILSDGATVPSWSPYLGTATQNGITANRVQLDITFNQGNGFSGNTYLGTWKFLALNRTIKSFATWQGSPYSFDAGSSYTP